MLATILSSAVLGIDAYIVKVEAHLERGLPYFTTVGLPDGAVRESKERVHAAIKNSGYDLPVNRTIINLAPAGIKKEGAAFDLPIAVGILAAKGIISRDRLGRYIILGELGLNGDVRPIRGVLSIAVNALKRKMYGLICPSQNANEAAIVDGLSVFPVSSLKQTVDFLNGRLLLKALHIDMRTVFNGHKSFSIDFSDIKGQGHAKRALEVAAAGGHNILMIGPPGSGKTMLAKRLPTILPDMSIQESLETTKIHSVAGQLSSSDALVSIRPFSYPHPTIS
jgi:magnesium chelatase family protein